MTRSFNGLLIVLSVILIGCSALPAYQAVDAAHVVHTAGLSQHMIAAKVPAEAPKVYRSFVRIINENADIEVVHQKDAAMLLEVTRDGLRITAQVTSLGSDRSLLYIWADAGDSGYTGEALASLAVDAIFEELGVEAERVDY